MLQNFGIVLTREQMKMVVGGDVVLDPLGDDWCDDSCGSCKSGCGCTPPATTCSKK
jgi:hypothetical protein